MKDEGRCGRSEARRRKERGVERFRSSFCDRPQQNPRAYEDGHDNRIAALARADRSENATPLVPRLLPLCPESSSPRTAPLVEGGSSCKFGKRLKWPLLDWAPTTPNACGGGVPA